MGSNHDTSRRYFLVASVHGRTIGGNQLLGFISLKLVVCRFLP